MNTLSIYLVRACSVAVLYLTATSTALSQLVAVTAGEYTKVGLSGGQFLKVGVGARGTAMAGAYSALSNDLTAIFWNPAGLAQVKCYGADFSQTFWLAGTTHSFAAASIPLSDKFKFAASFVSFSSGDIPITTTADPTGSAGGLYSVNDIAVGATLAGYLTEQFSFGVTARYVDHGFSSMSASGVSFDIGTRYKTGVKGLDLAFSINNLGTAQAYTGSDLTKTVLPAPGLNSSQVDAILATNSFDIPLSFRAGLGVNMFEGLIADKHEVDADGTIVHDWVVGADFETFADVPEQFAIGTEYTFREFVSLRAGYRFGQSEFGLSGGVGLVYRTGSFDGRLDYSVSPSANLGMVNRVSVSFFID